MAQLRGSETALEAWCARLRAAVAAARTSPRLADVAEMRRVLAAKPDAGLTGAWWDMVELASAWVEAIERRAVERLSVPAASVAALDEPLPRVHAWQTRADL